MKGRHINPWTQRVHAHFLALGQPFFICDALRIFGRPDSKSSPSRLIRNASILGRFHVVRVQRGDREVLLYEAVSNAAMVRRIDWRRIRIPSVWAMGEFIRSQAALNTFNQITVRNS